MPSNKANAVRRNEKQKNTLPGPIREALLTKASRDAERDEDLRVLPLVRAYREIYERQAYFIGQDAASQERWQKNFASRIVEFCSIAKTLALEERIRALKPRTGTRSDIRQWTAIAIELLKAGLAGDQRRVHLLMKTCPVEERWDLVFNDRWLLDEILEPGAPAHATHVAESGEPVDVVNSCEANDATDSSGPPDVADSATPVDANDSRQPVLGEHERNVLVALHEQRAFHSDHRRSIREIAEKVSGKGANPEQFKRVISRLIDRGYVETSRGQSGGCWLTPDGQKRAKNCMRT